MTDKPSPKRVVIDSETLSHAEVYESTSTLICQTRDGAFHRVMSQLYPAAQPDPSQRVVTVIKALLGGTDKEIMFELE